MTNFSKLVIFFVLLSGCSCAYSCKITITGRSPLFTKDFGSKTIVFRAHGSELSFENGDNIRAYCTNGVTVDSNYHSFNNDREVTFSCKENSVLVLDRFRGDVSVYCSPEANLNLYESKKKLPSCASSMSYAFGVKLPAVGDIVKAAVCFDLENLTIKFVTYIAHHKKISTFNKSNAFNESSVDLGEKVNGLKNYFNFIDEKSSDISQQLEKLPFNINEFQFKSLLQGDQLNNELNDYDYLFNTMWWRQLRQENWRYFLDALRERTHTAKYQVFMGTYGNITIPSMQSNCSSHKSEVVSVHNEDMTVRAPGYIWAYLKSLVPGETEEFVVIGHNSPYVRNPSHTDFCTTDICDDIFWLKESNFGNLRQLPSLGYTFCCRTEEVAKVIDHFPLYDDEVSEGTATTIPTLNIDEDENDSKWVINE